MAQEGPEVVSTSHKHCTTLSKKPITLHPPLLTEPSKQIQHSFSRQGLRLSRIPNKNSWITALTVFPQFKNAYRRARSVTTSAASSNWKFLQNAELLTLHNITGDFVPLTAAFLEWKQKLLKITSTNASPQVSINSNSCSYSSGCSSSVLHIPPALYHDSSKQQLSFIFPQTIPTVK